MAIALSGSLVITGSIFATQGITGSFSGSATSASYADTLQGLGSASFAPAETFNTVSQSFATTSGSIAGRVNIIETSYATTGSNTFTGPQYASEASNAISFTSTASLYTDGGLRVAKNSFVSGTAYFNDVVVYGTSSIQYITSSQVDIGANIITVNTDTPAVRFGGLSVFDSGSTQLTGSIFWDSEKNNWIYSNPSGSTYNSGMLISGPRNSGSLGSEEGTTGCALMMGQGGDHITSSAIFSYGNATCFYGGTAAVTSTGGVNVSDNIAYSTGVNSWYINTGVNGAVLRLKACGSAAGYSNRSGALGWTDNSGVKVDILGWNENIITGFKPINSCCNVNINTETGAGVGQNEITINTAGTAALNVMVNNTLTAYQYANGSSSIYATATNIPMLFLTNGTERARIFGTGITCFACQVCAPSFVGGAISGTTATFSGCLSTTAYSYLYGLRISGNDTGNTIYAGNSNMGITAESGYNISIGAVSDITKALNINTTNGIVGIAVTPSNWSSGGKLEYVGNGAIVAQSDYGNYGANYYYNGGYKRITSGYSTNYYQQQGAHLFQYTTNSTGANCIFTFCEAMRIANNGNVGIGCSSPTALLHVYANAAGTSTIAKFGAANYGNPSYKTYLQLGTQYSDGSSRIGSSNPSGNLSELFFETATVTSNVFAERLRISSDGTSCFSGNVCANTFSAYGMFGKAYAVNCTVGDSVAILDTGIGIGNNNTYLLTFTGNPAAAGGVYSWAEVGVLVVNSQYNGSSLTQMITYTKSGGGGTSVYPGALTLYPYFLVGGTEYTQTTSNQPSGQIRLKICGYSNSPGTSTNVWLTQLY